MLDLNHPMTQPIFEASALEDALKLRAQAMSVTPSVRRLELLAECQRALDQLRRLNRAHFENSAFIAQTIDETEEVLSGIAHAGDGKITEDHSDGEGICPVCQTPITRYEAGQYSSKVVYCSRCDEPFMQALAKLGSPQGFFTIAI